MNKKKQHDTRQFRTPLGLGHRGNCRQVANVIAQNAADDQKKHAEFTRQFVTESAEKYPGYNVVIIHTVHETHSRALPSIADRLLRMLVTTLKHRTRFDPSGGAATCSPPPRRQPHDLATPLTSASDFIVDEHSHGDHRTRQGE